MQHYFAIESNQKHLFFALSDQHHMRNVMRFKEGDKVVGIYQGQHYEVSLHLQPKEIFGFIEKALNVNHELSVHVTFIVGLPRQEKWEWILQKGTELGASRFIPWISERSLIKLSPEEGLKKVQRWGQVCKEAAEQSERNIIPLVDIPRNKLAFTDIQADQKMIAYERSPQSSLITHRLTWPLPKSVALVIGPEGGLSDNERAYFESLGFQIVSLGPRILRTETAALVMLSAIALKERSEPHAS